MKDDEDVKICLDRLLEFHVILEKDNQEIFRLIKKYSKDIQKICNNDLNMALVLNAHFAKIEKKPFHTEAFMGIEGFNETSDYVMFACAMAFVEESGPESPFILPDLTSYLKRTMPNDLDWTQYHIRKRLVRILQQMIALKIIIVLDGKFDDFDRNEEQVALFNSTNYSRYFLNMFSKNIQSLTDSSELVPISETKNISMQVIQRLFLSVGICRTNETESLFRYMRSEQERLTKFFEINSFYEFELSKNLGILVSENRRIGIKYIPDNGSSGDLLMLIGSKIRNRSFVPDEFGQLHLNLTQWQSIVSEVVQKNRELLSKAYREKSFESIAKELLMQTVNDGLILQSDGLLLVTPIFYRLNGEFTLSE
ncbi:DUF2398 family protein [Companilactobacillus nantensis]|uniref:Uncharacterized protein n=1 Tax=Companilactobacillus nantensis DSM 16982 TaxID=1423774 RepID=A0A0R1WHK2_9LACO|nr:DUF2398 family protein [Companilactobacillus nantensis]KRM15225.1 hypothetical protein FD31_GL001348 [Companilactobacillus nantensis DSM 16982]GEO65279.1 hypothetical protein LNA01_24620 [Companilactobacillus nantensis]